MQIFSQDISYSVDSEILHISVSVSYYVNLIFIYYLKIRSKNDLGRNKFLSHLVDYENETKFFFLSIQSLNNTSLGLKSDWFLWYTGGAQVNKYHNQEITYII